MMGTLYDVETQTINYHLKKVFGDSELEEASVIRKFRITAADGKSYDIQHYSLPAIIAVGYKVNSERAVQFRKWATGKGAHAWVFFASRISARDARRLGTAIISHTCARTRQLKLESYDRLFPNQDTMPKGGFGNLIALPLQKWPRESGYSVFVDADLRPYPDQWGFLASIQPMAAHDIEPTILRATGGTHPLDVTFIEDEDRRSVIRRDPETVQGQIGAGPDGDADPPRWSAANHLHAVRANPLHGGQAGRSASRSGSAASISPRTDRTAHRCRHPGRFSASRQGSGQNRSHRRRGA